MTTYTPPAGSSVNTDLFVKPGESIQDYETRLGKMNSGVGTGFGAPAPISLPSGIPNVTDAKVTDTASAEDRVAKQLGYGSYQEAVSQLTAPADDTTAFYNNAYQTAGLDQVLAKINQRSSDLNKALGTINDNPWLDEATRVGRSKTLQDLANADIKNYQSAYDAGIKQVNQLAANHHQELQSTAAASKAKLAALESQAKQLASEAATNTKNESAAPKTLKAADGTTYQWNPTTNSFDVLFPGKATSDSTPKVSSSDAISSMNGEIQTLLTAPGYSTDGYINPNDWDTALKAWNARGLSTTSFISNFKRYANPNDTYIGITSKSGSRTL